MATEKKPRRIAEGVCPYCGSENMEYGSFEFGDDGGYYRVQCLDCREYFDEWYDLTFAGQHLHNGEYLLATENGQD